MKQYQEILYRGGKKSRNGFNLFYVWDHEVEVPEVLYPFGEFVSKPYDSKVILKRQTKI